MSRWTYVTGWVLVNPLGRTQEEMEYVLKSVLNHLPVVTGSEEDMYVHIIRAGGHNCSSSHDEYNEWTNNLTDECGKKSRLGGWLQTQDNYYLFIEGHFRDTLFDETYRQFIKWLIRLAKRVRVCDADVLVSGDWDSRSERINAEFFDDIWELPSWSTWRDKKYIYPYEDYDTNWCEHLLWWAEKDGENNENDRC